MIYGVPVSFLLACAVSVLSSEPLRWSWGTEKKIGNLDLLLFRC